MSVWKAELRAEVGEHLGVRLEDSLEAARAEVHRTEGARQAFRQMGEKLEQYLRGIDGMVESSQIPSLEEADRTKRHIGRCQEIARSMGIGAEIQFHVTRGKVEALAAEVKVLKVFVDAERGRAKALAAQIPPEPASVSAPEPAAPPRRVVGQRPVDAMAERRAAASETPVLEAGIEGLQREVAQVETSAPLDPKPPEASKPSKRKRRR